MRADNGSPEFSHGVDKKMITYHLSQMLLLTIIFSATRTPANVQGARDFSKKGKILYCNPIATDKNDILITDVFECKAKTNVGLI